MIKRKITLLILIFLLLAVYGVSFADEICPSSEKWPSASGAEELKMYEKDFTLDKAMKSVKYLENEIPTLIKKHEHKKYSILSQEDFYIGYPNNLTYVKGTLLKQAAVIAKNKLEIEQLKLKQGTTSKEKVSEASKAYLTSQKKFCDFLKRAEYVD